MKSFIGLLLVASVALTGVLSLPAGNPSDDAEVIGYPRRVNTRTQSVGNDDDDGFNDFKGVIDTGSGYPFLQPNPSVLNFGFFDSFDDLFRRFRARIWPDSAVGSSDDDSDEVLGSGIFGANVPKGGNTTSTVKVVDGHKVEVNETVYGDEHSVFKVRVVNVRPLEEGETVEETVRTGSVDNDNTKPVTSSPTTKQSSTENDDDDDEEGRREPLAKKPNDNEIQGNIDDPEHLSVTENIIEVVTATTTTTAINDNANTRDELEQQQQEQENKEEDKMLPTTTENIMEFVTDHPEGVDDGNFEGDALTNNGNGNNEFETNMSLVGNTRGSGRGGEQSALFADADVDAEGGAIENNEDTQQVNDNLNESSSTSDDEDDDDNNNNNNNDKNNDNDEEDSEKERINEFEDVETDDEDEEDTESEVTNANVRLSNYAVIRNKQREDATSSDDDEADGGAGVVVMHPTFQDEWGTLNTENKENNDLSNDIDVYDVEPIDLSNDIAVNDDATLPINPDAEFIDVYGSKQTLSNMPKFEKLSLSEMPESVEHLSFSGEDMK